MSVAPKVKKRSAAQIAAGKNFAAAGRAAQASARAAAIKKTGKAPPRSKAQKAATAKFLAAGQAALRARAAGKTPVKPKAKGALMPDELLYPGFDWPLGCNDAIPTCASVAVAAHMQAVTGLTLTDAEILKLHNLAGGDKGAQISDVLEAMAGNALSFCYGRVKLLHFFRTDEQFLLSGLVVGVRLPHTGHAVVSAPGGMISWGRYMPWEGEPEEAWCLEWGP